MFGDIQKKLETRLPNLSEIVANGKIVTYGIVQAGPHIEDGVPYIKTGDIKNGIIVENNLSKTSHSIAQSYARSAVATNDIVMSIRATVGTTALVPESLNGANLTQGTARISAGKSVRPEYLLCYLRSEAVQRWIQKHVKGATFREITLAKLRELPVFVPELSMQNKFIEIYFSIENQIKLANDALNKQNNLFSSLQHAAFSGQL